VTRRFDLLVFDWDGTLMDSAERIVNCFRAAAVDVGVCPPDAAAVRDVIGLGMRESVERVLPEADEDTVVRVIERYGVHFLELDPTPMPLFAGVEEGLARLRDRGFRLAVATGKSRRGLNRALASTGLEERFEATRCADESLPKPDPRMLHDLVGMTGVAPERALMVGDTTYDLEMARRAGVSSLAVSYGAHDAQRLGELMPLGCLASFEDVVDWLS